MIVDNGVIDNDEVLTIRDRVSPSTGTGLRRSNVASVPSRNIFCTRHGPCAIFATRYVAQDAA